MGGGPHFGGGGPGGGPQFGGGGQGGPPHMGGGPPHMGGGGGPQFRQVSVHVFAANNLPAKSGFMDKTDPYVELIVGNQKKQTSVQKKAGSNANFNETLLFDYNGEGDLTINVYDKDRFKDDFLGTGVLAIGDKLRGYQGTVAIFDKKGKNNGDVTVRVTGQ
eukprot:Protomagalhaensia_wolfi_Nauph_80__3008@NODE_3082_length_898_cov_1200_837020_g2414_i0_p1_GENE_NODE_3082_length_898_cov_1200_837020_g2414_i0NODE_3082_length_898_cov_1200_837020_g2414_i0_p1_ORF_typecomplete_len162_score42_76C2/PF00168_30/5_5e18_NODE_3082_length_898_cov_1200_837020_g2414_i0316801